MLRRITSGIQATPNLTDTNALRTKSLLEPKSVDRFSGKTLDCTASHKYGIEAIVESTTGNTKTSERSSTVAHIPGSVVKQIKPRIVLDLFDTERTVISARRLSVRHDKKTSGNDNFREMGSVYPTTTQIVVENAKCVTLKRESEVKVVNRCVCMPICVFDEVQGKCPAEIYRLRESNSYIVTPADGHSRW